VLSYLQQAVETKRLMTIGPAGITPERQFRVLSTSSLPPAWRESRPKRATNSAADYDLTCDEKRATTYKPQLRSNTSTQLVSSSPLGETIPSIKPGSLRRSSADLDHECFFIVRLTAVLQRNGDFPQRRNNLA
jgi:hypothetical protein